MMNIINGGAHADNSVDVQEFMIAPFGAPKFSEALRMGVEVFHTLKKVLKQEGLLHRGRRRGRLRPHAEVERRGHRSRCSKPSPRPATSPASKIGICLDPAASEFYQDGKYVFKKSDKSERTSEQMVEFWANWVQQVSGHRLHRRRHVRGRLGRLEAA